MGCGVRLPEGTLKRAGDPRNDAGKEVRTLVGGANLVQLGDLARVETVIGLVSSKKKLGWPLREHIPLLPPWHHWPRLHHLPRAVHRSA